jgi:hypothetical protein
MININRLEITDTTIVGFPIVEDKEILSVTIPYETLPNKIFKIGGSKEFLSDFIKLINRSIG